MNFIISIFTKKKIKTYFYLLPYDLIDQLLSYIWNEKDMNSIFKIILETNKNYPWSCDLADRAFWKKLYYHKLGFIFSQKEILLLLKVKLYGYKYFCTNEIITK